MWRGEEKEVTVVTCLFKLIPKEMGIYSRIGSEEYNQYQHKEHNVCFCLQNQLEGREQLEMIVIYSTRPEVVVAEKERQNELKNVRNI